MVFENGLKAIGRSDLRGGQCRRYGSISELLIDYISSRLQEASWSLEHGPFCLLLAWAMILDVDSVDQWH